MQVAIVYLLCRVSRSARSSTSENERSAPRPPRERIAIRSASAAWKALEGPVPIVFTHTSNSEYLQYSLLQARRSNPDSPIYLIGDEANRGQPGVDHHHLVGDYFENAAEFARLYRHMSPNGFKRELFCFQRWLVVREFMHRTGLESCVCLDSDVMLFSDLSAERRRFGVFEMALVELFIPCTVFVNAREALDDFCDFTIDIYRQKRGYEWDCLIAHHALRLKNGLPGGVSDMTAFELFHKKHFGRVGDLGKIADGSVYDDGIADTKLGFEMRDGMKRLSWEDGVPYGFHPRSIDPIRFHTLHCQGRHGGLMKEIYTRASRGEVNELSTSGHASPTPSPVEMGPIR